VCEHRGGSGRSSRSPRGAATGPGFPRDSDSAPDQSAVRLATHALKAEAAQRAFELGYTCSDALEFLTGEREEPHRRARHDGGRPPSRQKECISPNVLPGSGCHGHHDRRLRNGHLLHRTRKGGFLGDRGEATRAQALGPNLEVVQPLSIRRRRTRTCRCSPLRRRRPRERRAPTSRAFNSAPPRVRIEVSARERSARFR
jgi:hypothetical protein